jgi:hypothetical protein
MSATLGWADALWLARRRTPNDRLRFWGCVLSSAVTAALLCTAAGLFALRDGLVISRIQVVADPGTRGGVAFAVVLVALPALHLTGQTWKLGSIERRARMRQLQHAGAGPDQLRRVAVADTVIPVAVGATFGVIVLALTIAVLNLSRQPASGYHGVATPAGAVDIGSAMAVVPNVVVASWWPPLMAVGAVTAGAAAAAARSVRHLDHPWHRRPSLVGLVAGRVAQRTTRPDLLLALRRITAEPMTTTRPAMLLGLAAVIASASTWLYRQARFVAGEARWKMDDYYSQAYNLVWLATAVGIALCALGLVVALSDAVVRRRRTDAAAVAAGVPAATLRRALTLQTLLPAVPAILFGLALGGATAVAFTGRAVGGWLGEPAADEPLLPLPWGLWASWGVALIVAATLAALIASTALRRTTQPDQLRVPA